MNVCCAIVCDSKNLETSESQAFYETFETQAF